MQTYRYKWVSFIILYENYKITNMSTTPTITPTGTPRKNPLQISGQQLNRQLNIYYTIILIE